MEIKTIGLLLVLNIALPTWDTWGDINLVFKLFRGAQYCDSDDYLKCYKDKISFCSIAKHGWECRQRRDSYCSKDEKNQTLCDTDLCEYLECRHDPVSYCSMTGINQTLCRFSSHPKMAAAIH